MATSDGEAQADDVELAGPFDEQEPFLWNDKTYYGYISGVGAGKTFAGILRTALNAQVWNPGEMGAIVAPTTTMIKDVIIPEMRSLGLMDRWEYKSAHTEEPGIHTPEGGRILLLSADNRRTIERLAGLNLAYWWLDEASRVPPRAHEILTQRLRVGQYRNGFMTTTPMGRDHVFDMFVGDHPDGEWRDYGEADVYSTSDRLAITRVPTWANPHTADDYKEQMQNKEGQVYEREILGRFVDFEGLIYPWFRDDQPPEGHVIEEAPDNIQRVYFGVDWGFNNPSVILAIGETNDGRVVVLEEFCENRVTTADLAGVAERMQERHRPGTFYCDAAEPDRIEEFQRAGLDAVAADKSVQAGISSVTAARDDLRVMESCQDLINEFGMYRYKDGDETEKPVEVNDHALDALRYALHTGGGEDFNVGVAFG